MNKIDLLYGFISGIVLTFIGVFTFISVFTDYSFWYGIQIMQANSSLGKLIAVGAVLNIMLFFFFLKIHKDLMARGVILATMTLAIITIFL